MKSIKRVIMLMACLAGTAHAAVSEDERNALISFYDATGGGSWTESENWLVDDPCENAWFNVECNGDNTTVERIFLPDNNLVGGLPSDLGALSNLILINLQDNSLSGAIPAELGSLSNLTDLFLDQNSLSGDIPETLASLPVLRNLDLSDNMLSDASLPITWSSALQLLALDNNQLSGTIPPELGSLANLTRLQLDDNQFSGVIPAELGDLASIRYLRLNSNQLVGPLPSNLGSLSTLFELRLDANKISGELPGSFTGMISLLGSSALLSFNGLFTDDETLDAFFNEKGGENWSASQTIAPQNLQAEDISASCVTLSWDVIEFLTYPGYYEVFYSTNPGGPYTMAAGQTDSKNDTEHTYCELNGGTSYYFAIRTFTGSHLENDNAVTSLFSAELEIETPAPPPNDVFADGFETP